MNPTSLDLPEGTYVELVRSLFSTLLPSCIMSIAFCGIGTLILAQTPDRTLALLITIGAAASLARIAVSLRYRRWAREESLDMTRARQVERRFALSYLGFAAVLGAFGARAFAVALPQADMLIVGLLVGYGAGVAAGLSLRPRISVPSVLIAIVPTIVVAGMTPDITSRAAALLMAALLVGGISSMLGRFRSETHKITMRRTFATLARHDHLTELPNRLALAERFAALGARTGDHGIAVHCLDLDRFKSVNDRYGHPTGDTLLVAVGQRLNSLLRRSDFAARLGGDEFVVIQTDIRHQGEAEMLGRRIARTLADPYTIDGRSIRIGASVGYALSADCGADLDRLMTRADEALREAKQRSPGSVVYRSCVADEDQARLIA